MFFGSNGEECINWSVIQAQNWSVIQAQNWSVIQAQYNDGHLLYVLYLASEVYIYTVMACNLKNMINFSKNLNVFSTLMYSSVYEPNLALLEQFYMLDCYKHLNGSWAETLRHFHLLRGQLKWAYKGTVGGKALHTIQTQCKKHEFILLN